jgi:hypothetical protein
MLAIFYCLSPYANVVFGGFIFVSASLLKVLFAVYCNFLYTIDTVLVPVPYHR